MIDEEEGITLADIYMQDPSQMSEEDLEVFYPMFLSMSKGQLATLSGLSLARSISYVTCANEDIQEAVSIVNENCNPDNIKTISVFEGVDRSIFTEKNIAMTSAAMRTNALNNSKSTSQNETAVYVLGGISILCSVASITLGSLYIYGAPIFIKDGSHVITELAYMWQQMSGIDAWYTHELPYWCFEETPVFNTGTLNVLGTAFAVVTTVAVLTAVAALLIQHFIDMGKDKREKTTIPAIILDEDSNERLAEMISYHAVKDTNGNSADIANGKETEWYALYWSKKEAAGTPLTAEFLTTSNPSDDTIDQTKYRPVHMMGSISTSCFNVNVKSGTKNYLYIGYVSEDTAADNTAATTVSYGGYALAGLGGALIGSLLTFLAGKRRIKSGS